MRQQNAEEKEKKPSQEEKRDRLYLFSSHEFDSGFKNISRVSLTKHYDFETGGDSPRAARTSGQLYYARTSTPIREAEGKSEGDESEGRRRRIRGLRSSNETADWSRRPRWLRTQEGELLSEEGEDAASESSTPVAYMDEGALRRVDSGYINRAFELERNNLEKARDEEEQRRAHARLAKSLETRFNEQDTRTWSLATMVRRKAVLASEFFFRTVFSGEVHDRLYTPEKRERQFERRAYVARPSRASR